MSFALSQQISRYYDFYRDKEIVFTKETLHYLRLDPRQIYIKCSGGQWPCIINSTSFQFAKVIIGTTSGVFAQINNKKAEVPVSVRYCFIESDNSPLSFFVNGKVTEIVPFKDSGELVVVTVTFTQRPPDDLLFRLGQFIETNENFSLRKEERIVINQDTIRKLALEKEETLVNVAMVPRRCVLRDLSFGGAKIMCMGIPKFMIDKKASLKITFTEPQISVDIPGTVKHAECLEGRKDIVTANIVFDEASVPMVYKVQINEFIMNNKKTLLELNRANAENADPAAEQEKEDESAVQKIHEANTVQIPNQQNKPHPAQNAQLAMQQRMLQQQRMQMQAQRAQQAGMQQQMGQQQMTPQQIAQMQQMQQIQRQQMAQQGMQQQMGQQQMTPQQIAQMQQMQAQMAQQRQQQAQQMPNPAQNPQRPQ